MIRPTPHERVLLAANARIQGAYTGRRCFVLANGPSLRNVDLNRLTGELTIVMNHFNQHPAIKELQPVIHCAAEPATSYNSPGRMRRLEDLLEGYESTIHVFPIEMTSVLIQAGLLPPDRIAPVKLTPIRFDETDRIDLTKPMPAPPDTSVLAVSVAIAMGCTPIVILGLDYNWLSHRAINAHFYDDAAMPWPVEDMSRQPYVEVMRQAITCWEAHSGLRRIAEGTGQIILNATENSFLDVYQTTNLDKLLD
jgi:hypothetical protein